MNHQGARPETGPHGDGDARYRWLRRIAWLVAIWCASVAALGVVAFAFRGIMGWVGLTR